MKFLLKLSVLLKVLLSIDSLHNTMQCAVWLSPVLLPHFEEVAGCEEVLYSASVVHSLHKCSHGQYTNRSGLFYFQICYSVSSGGNKVIGKY